MAKGKRRIYWDTCIFLAWLKNENRAAGEMEGVAEVADLISRDQVDLATSVMTHIEVLQSSLSTEQKEKFSNVFQRPNVVRISLDIRIANLAHLIRDHYRQKGTKLSTPDVVHLATAIYSKVDEMHTFDEDDLLPLNGNVAGHSLLICKPRAIQGILSGFLPSS